MNMRRGLLALALAALFIAVTVALIGGAGSGSAATVVSITLTSPQDQSQLGGVSYSGKIGYKMTFANSGDSTVSHVQVIVDSDVATFSDVDSSICAANPKDATQMLCTPPGGTLVPGDSFTVNFRFTAPAGGGANPPTSVMTTAHVTVAAQTKGNPNNNGTTIATSQTVTTPLLANSDASEDTFARPTESVNTGKLSSGHPQNFDVDVPSSLFQGYYGIAVGLLDSNSTPPGWCSSCLPWHTSNTIPFASDANQPFIDPFTNGTTNSPYTWKMNAQYPPGFKLNGVIYVADNGTTYFPVPSCDSVALSPLNPVCVDALSLVQDTKTKTLHATGHGIQNGNFGWG